MGALLAVRESPVGGEWEPCGSETALLVVSGSTVVVRGNPVGTESPVGSEGEPCW